MNEQERQEAVELAQAQVKSGLEAGQAERVAQEHSEKIKEREEFIDFARQSRIVGRRS